MSERRDSRDERDLALLRERAVLVAAFKARVNTAGMTRPSRAPEELVFLEQHGVALPFIESGKRVPRERDSSPSGW